MSEKVGFIGLGIMGKPMARNLMQAGYELLIYNRSPQAMRELQQQGAATATTAEEVASASGTIITMLPDSPQVEHIVGSGSNESAEGAGGGILQGASRGSLIVDMSTISPVVTRDLAARARERGVGYVDAPVSGGDVGAQQGTLSIMAGGTQEDFHRAKPLFDVLGQTVVHVGEAGAGQVVKACNQIVVALTIEAVSEALVLGSRAGVEPQKVLDVLGGGLASNKVMELKRDKLLSHDFSPGGKVDSQHKDLGISLATARSYGVALPLTAAVDQMYAALRSRGGGSLDHSALLEIIEDMSTEKYKSR